MKYFFVLGSNPTLSIAEIAAVFDKEKVRLSLAGDKILIMERKDKIDTEKIMRKMGGVIKIGRVEKIISKRGTEEIVKHLKEMFSPGAGKFKFGISYYGPDKSRILSSQVAGYSGKVRDKFDIKPMAMEIKNHLKKMKISCRWVVSREKTLSSVVVEQNKLITQGIEIVLIGIKDGKILIGKTLAVQLFRELAFRDYGRPGRDKQSGMLPPKLAQIMINLSQVSSQSAFLDPFCGSGTILTEAMLGGYKNLIGSDISLKAVRDTRRNIEWIKEGLKSSLAQLDGKNKKLKIFQSDVKKLSEKVPLDSIEAIVTEPYLGPSRGRVGGKSVVGELEDLYSKALAEFRKVLKLGGRVVMIWPIFRQRGQIGERQVGPDIDGYRIENPIPRYLEKNKILQLTPRRTIIYGRPGQKIWREVVILRLNNKK